MCVCVRVCVCVCACVLVSQYASLKLSQESSTSQQIEKILSIITAVVRTPINLVLGIIRLDRIIFAHSSTPIRKSLLQSRQRLPTQASLSTQRQSFSSVNSACLLTFMTRLGTIKELIRPGLTGAQTIGLPVVILFKALLSLTMLPHRAACTL